MEINGNGRNLIVRKVKVNRSRTPQQMLDATGRLQHSDETLVDEVFGVIPNEGAEEVAVVLVLIGKDTSTDDTDKLLEENCLVADPYALAQVNADDPAFADSHPNLTQWRDDNGRACYLLFDGKYDHHNVGVGRGNNCWSDFWWLAGVRK